MTILHMRIGCCAPNATNTHLDYVTLTAFSMGTLIARMRHNVMLYAYCLSSFISSAVHFVSPPVHADCPARHPP